jgi:lipopolysaccharide transport system ATP-binding protein
VSFSVGPGEAVGIVGQNGAGKSTLLKIITGTTCPTQGEVQLHGRVAAILELGMGFNPDLTGRQNAYHSAGLMGYSQADIERAMPQIEAFAEVGEYFDQAVRTYSSGMQMRVAFSVATAFKPDLLIVDEALSVGDAAFQRKCFRRVETYMNQGMALLLVSHDIESIKKICTKALFLNHGCQHGYGDAKEICDAYEQHLFGSRTRLHEAVAAKVLSESNTLLDPSLLSVNELSYGDGRAEIEEVWLENNAGNRINVINSGSTFALKYRVRFNTSVRYPVFAFLIKTMEGISLYGTDTLSLNEPVKAYKAGDRIIISFHMGNHLAAGTYFINCGIREEGGETSIYIHRRVDVAMFKVIQARDFTQAGLVNLSASFSAE